MSQADLIIMRPLGVGRILDRAVRLYRRNFLSFLGIVAIAQIPASIAVILLGSRFATPDGAFDLVEDPTNFIAGTLLTVIITLILTQIATAAITQAIGNQYLGKETGIIDAYRELGSRWLALLGALFVASVVSIGLALFAIVVPCLGWFTGFGMLAYFGFVITPFLAPIIVLEEHSAVSAWRRVWDLVRQRFWWTLLFALVLQLFTQLFVAAPTSLLQLLLGSLTTDDNLFTFFVIPQLVQLAGNLIVLPLTLTAITLFYFDLRVRNEGLDMAIMVESAAGEEVTEADVLTSGIKSNPTLVTTSELTGFFAIEVGFFALYFLFLGLAVLISLASF